MGRQRAFTPLNVYVGSRLAGRLTRTGAGAHYFHYSEEWLSWEMNFPLSLSLLVRKEPYSGSDVINLFENLLPDHTEIRQRLAAKVGARGTDAFNLLSKIGRDCVGAMQFIPEGDALVPSHAISGRELTESQVEKLLANLSRSPLGLGDEDAFRISIAGVQDKTALLRLDGKWIEPHGTTPTTHIFKPQIGHLPSGIDLTRSVENEHFCLELLRCFGVPTVTSGIEQFGAQRVLVVTRYDRKWTQDGRLIRLPQEDFCQALSVPPSLKYQDQGGPGIVPIARTLLGSDTPREDRALFLRSIMLFWLMGATDGHAKNFSIFIRPGGRYQLAPLYDVLSVEPSVSQHFIAPKQVRMAMRVGKKGHYRAVDIRGKDFIQTGAQAGYSESEVQAAMHFIHTSWERAFQLACAHTTDVVPDQIAKSIESAFRARLPRLTP